jgi:hypothetical protein
MKYCWSAALLMATKRGLSPDPALGAPALDEGATDAVDAEGVAPGLLQAANAMANAALSAATFRQLARLVCSVVIELSSEGVSLVGETGDAW